MASQPDAVHDDDDESWQFSTEIIGFLWSMITPFYPVPCSRALGV